MKQSESASARFHCGKLPKRSNTAGLFPIPTADWFIIALAYPGITLLPLTPQIAVESTRLPDKFHKDPADQIIVATARIYNYPLVTYDAKILNYKHVKLLP